MINNNRIEINNEEDKGHILLLGETHEIDNSKIIEKIKMNDLGTIYNIDKFSQIPEILYLLKEVENEMSSKIIKKEQITIICDLYSIYDCKYNETNKDFLNMVEEIKSILERFISLGRDNNIKLIVSTTTTHNKIHLKENCNHIFLLNKENLHFIPEDLKRKHNIEKMENINFLYFNQFNPEKSMTTSVNYEYLRKIENEDTTKVSYRLNNFNLFKLDTLSEKLSMTKTEIMETLLSSLEVNTLNTKKDFYNKYL